MVSVLAARLRIVLLQLLILLVKLTVYQILASGVELRGSTCLVFSRRLISLNLEAKVSACFQLKVVHWCYRVLIHPILGLVRLHCRRLLRIRPLVYYVDRWNFLN